MIRYTTRPDDQTWWQKLTGRPSAAQRGWDWAIEFILSKPTEAEWRDTLRAHEANLYHDPSPFDHAFESVVTFYHDHGLLPGEGNLRQHRLDCMFCGRPGMECIDTDLCDTFPHERYAALRGGSGGTPGANHAGGSGPFVPNQTAAGPETA